MLLFDFKQEATRWKKYYYRLLKDQFLTEYTVSITGTGFCSVMYQPTAAKKK